MSAFHQSVYNGLTASAQREALHIQSNNHTTTETETETKQETKQETKLETEAKQETKLAEDELCELESPPVRGYYLCNPVYAPLVYASLCRVLHGPQLRLVTAQSCVYVLRYILSNHIYGEMLPCSVIEELATLFPFLFSLT